MKKVDRVVCFFVYQYPFLSRHGAFEDYIRQQQVETDKKAVLVHAFGVKWPLLPGRMFFSCVLCVASFFVGGG